MIALILSALLVQESADLDAVVRKHVDEAGPGLAVLAIKDGKVLHKKGYGLADLKAKTPVTAETLFDLASCSKQFTAIAILQLQEKGKLKGDADVRTWLKEMRVHDKDRQIRVQDLVYHASGLTDYLGLAGEISDPASLDNEGVLKLIADRGLEFRTGRKWAYSNSNYCLLALLVERITKKS
ncbi:MAG TPA: serine hydrolase domain-containing protein, partial [Planctomycetota bacterium]|nr:serine hydrolase domain-containing protein [Planctomycetota bacterium]